MNKVKIVQGNITCFHGDAIVNAANSSLLGGGGVDGAIHEAAGFELFKACQRLNGCKTGEAKITDGYNLPAKYVIHAVGPVWAGGGFGEEILLASCYRSSMEIAKQVSIKSIAFPLISAGAYGYPKREAIEVALSTLGEYAESGIDITLILYDTETYELAKEVANDAGTN